MKILKIENILEVTNGKLIIGDKNLECDEFCTDTRKIKKGDTYIGIKGQNFNGNEYYEEALEKGAEAVVVSGVNIKEEVIEKFSKKTIIEVKDSLVAFGQIAKYKRSLYDIPVIEVTGSVGKTSTRDIIANVIKREYKTLKTQGNFNNAVGLPTTILGLKDHEALVVETGMNHFGEISYLTNIANPTIAVITNIGSAHIGNLGSRKNILKAKLEILEGLKSGGFVVINNDNDLLHKWNIEDTKYNKITYGIDNKSDIQAYDIKIEQDSSSYKVKLDQKEYEVIVPVSGKHFIYNSLSAIAVGKILKINPTKIIEGIKEFELTKRRMEINKINNNITVINDSYNASYDSMKAAIEYLKDINGKRKIAILGDMLELGDFEEELHRKVGKEIFINKIDILVTVGERAEFIAKEAKEVGMLDTNITSYKSNGEAINFLKKNMKNGDVILLKASNSMKFTEILNGIR